MTESEIVLTFGGNLRRISEARGLSGNQLAKRAGIPRRNIFRYLAFESIPRADKIAQICDALCCAPDELFRTGAK